MLTEEKAVFRVNQFTEEKDYDGHFRNKFLCIFDFESSKQQFQFDLHRLWALDLVFDGDGKGLFKLFRPKQC